MVLQGSLAILEYAGSNKVPFGDISALRMLRVLRPLKSLRKFPEMRLLVTHAGRVLLLYTAFFAALEDVLLFERGPSFSFFFNTILKTNGVSAKRSRRSSGPSTCCSPSWC